MKAPTFAALSILALSACASPQEQIDARILEWSIACGAATPDDRLTEAWIRGSEADRQAMVTCVERHEASYQADHKMYLSSTGAPLDYYAPSPAPAAPAPPTRWITTPLPGGGFVTRGW